MFIRFVLPLSISYHDQYMLILSSLHLLLYIYCYPCASCYCYTCISVSHYPLSSLCISRYLVDAYISVLCSSLSSFTDAWPIYIHCPSLMIAAHAYCIAFYMLILLSCLFLLFLTCTCLLYCYQCVCFTFTPTVVDSYMLIPLVCLLFYCLVDELTSIVLIIKT